MESIARIKLTDRFAIINDWLKNICQLENYQITVMTPDASFRRYYRIQDAKQTYVLMDAPPPEKSCEPYIRIADCLRQHGLQTPVIYHAQLDIGLLLLSDFGDDTYIKALNNSNADQLYRNALTSLAIIANISFELPKFDAEFMWQEWLSHKEWFLDKYLQMPFMQEEAALDDCMQKIIESAVNQTQVFMHRDYHSANLMVHQNDVGILDFQDAFIGPVTYDLVSLLRDCYIAWPQHDVMRWVEYYYQLLISHKIIDIDIAIFYQWFDLMGLQRHLKALLTFSRKKVRDNHPQYLKHMPRTLDYIITVSGKYPELGLLHRFYKEKVVQLCVQ